MALNPPVKSASELKSVLVLAPENANLLQAGSDPRH